jgi:hypothetical protein
MRFMRFANVDYALALGLRQRPLKDAEDVDHVVSYDCACQYCVNARKRFAEFLPDVAPIIERARWAVPALHVQGHKEDCMYAFSTAYMEGVGHFHGETAEHYWPEANQLGPHVRQMNTGHRQDTLDDHHGDWNWKKTMNLCGSLIPCLSGLSLTGWFQHRH